MSYEPGEFVFVAAPGDGERPGRWWARASEIGEVGECGNDDSAGELGEEGGDASPVGSDAICVGAVDAFDEALERQPA